MAPLKHLLATCGLASALASSCAADSCETGDQTALLQSHLSRKSDLSLTQHSAHSAAFFPKLSALNDKSTRKAALLEVEKTAVQLAEMDKTEATPIVIEVCTEVANMLNDTILFHITEEHHDDQNALTVALSHFDEWQNMTVGAREALEAALDIVTQRANALAMCRTVEIETCINETICTEEENDHCADRDVCERELQEIDEEIHREWCESGATPEIRSSTEFRTTTVEVFHRYTVKLTELERLQLLCDEVNMHCDTTLATYIEQATQCNTKQAELQMASCEYHHLAGQRLREYQQGFLATLQIYNDLMARTMIAEADRKVEWDVLTRIICLLLTLTNSDDGVVSNEETAARIQRCWDDEVDVSHLDIEYRDPPDMLTLPDLPPLPCTADYDDHYDLGPPAACAALVEIHNTQATSECSCLADELADQSLILGHYLMVDPAVPLTVAGGSWNVQLDGETYGGQVSTLHEGAFPELSAAMLTEDQLDESDDDYTGPIAKIGWAYPSVAADWGEQMSLSQRFASRGGMVFLNANNEVVAVRELASSSGPLGQPVAATLSFSSAEEITDEQAAAACPNGLQQVSDNSRYHAQGAREYCWVMSSSLAQCTNGCFIYQLVSGKVVFPLIEGMHLSQ